MKVNLINGVISEYEPEMCIRVRTPQGSFHFYKCTAEQVRDFLPEGGDVAEIRPYQKGWAGKALYVKSDYSKIVAALAPAAG